ncbi:hypothetical protein D3C84_1054850 [compost metagenome]
MRNAFVTPGPIFDVKFSRLEIESAIEAAAPPINHVENWSTSGLGEVVASIIASTYFCSRGDLLSSTNFSMESND